MPIRIINLNFDVLGEIDDYESLVYTRRFYKTGEFELHINNNRSNTDVLKEDNIIMLDSDGHKAGIIRHREIKTDNDGSEELTIKGSSLSSILTRRITLPPVKNASDSASGKAETVMKHYIDANCINPSDLKRKIPNLVLAADKGRGPVISYQSRLKELDSEIETIAENTKLGFEIYLDIENKKFVFDVLDGRNFTVSQNELPPVIFSVDFDNVTSQNFIDSAVNYKNYGYVGGKGEGADRKMLEVGSDASGFDRIEAFVDASDTEEDNLGQAGRESLLESSRVQTFESDILQNNFIYGKDYDLGDMVTVQNRRWGITLDTPITEIVETYESGGLKLSATFGNNIPTLIDKIKQSLNKPLTETKTEITTLENDAKYDTSSGAQQKADDAEKNAKSYADSQDEDILKSAKSYADIGDTNTLSNAKNYSDAGDGSTLKSAKQYSDQNKSDVQNNLNNHINDSIKHITQNERSTWNSKANGSHTHVKSDITDFPSSMPANGGNADTVDGHSFNWSGKAGQPTWLWGGNDSDNMYVYNPSNFNVNKAAITHRLYRHDPESEDSYYISPWWTANSNGWRIGAYNTNGDTQANIHKVSVDKSDYADSAGNSDTVDGKHAGDFAPSGFGLGTAAKDISGQDLNSKMPTGFYKGSNLKNAPGSSWFYIINIQHDNSWIYEEAISYSDSTFNQGLRNYYRVLDNGTWSSWQIIAKKSDIPTKISQFANDSGFITQSQSGLIQIESSTQPSGHSSGRVWLQIL